MNKIIKLASIIMLGMTASLTAFSQGVPPVGSFTVNSITLPNAILAASGSTNLANGWSTVESITNTTTLWDSATSAFVSTTNVTSYTNTVYADMNIKQAKDLAIYITDTVSAAGTNTYTLAYGLDSSHVDSNNTSTIVVKHAAAGTATASVNLPRDTIGGFGVVRVIAEAFTAASGNVTNVSSGISYSTKKSAW